RRQILRAAARLPAPACPAADVDRALEAALLAGFADRVARGDASRRGGDGPGATVALSEGGSAVLRDPSALGPEGLTLVLEARSTAPGQPAQIDLAAAIHLDTLLDAADRVVLEE